MDCYASKITSGGTPAPLQPSEEFLSAEYTYLVASETGTACLDVMHAVLAGDLATVVNNPQSGIHATVLFDMVADDPERSDSGDLFDLEDFNMQMPFCVSMPPGFLTLKFRIRNDSGEEVPAINGSILFSFMIMPEHMGDDVAPSSLLSRPTQAQGGTASQTQQQGKVVAWY